ncbi:NlpC/P60 family protein [Candidatus Pelagibacter communis]|uniref:C40 family peptidase n=1 Tax=Pelagibacter ubique TaxID=198252 RepID=UPI00094C9587|nr:NlpC/P60 family protein [Candidatus Pelagibacter ubique]
MKNYFLNIPVSNIYSKPSIKSEITSQMLYGEKFKILSKKKNWVKIKTSFDNYKGFIKDRIFFQSFKANKKVNELKSKIYKKLNNKFFPTKKFLYFASGISVIKESKNFVQFEKNKWIKKKHLKSILHTEKNYKKIFKQFTKSKYLWGGKTSEGIDCSALIQIYYYYNRVFFPRDSKDQIKYCKKRAIKNFKEGNIIFWKGHVGVCLNQNMFIHAYGPRKKVVIMPIKFTINLIKTTANLDVKKISNIKKF